MVLKGGLLVPIGLKKGTEKKDSLEPEVLVPISKVFGGSLKGLRRHRHRQCRQRSRAALTTRQKTSPTPLKSFLMKKTNLR